MTTPRLIRRESFPSPTQNAVGFGAMFAPEAGTPGPPAAVEPAWAPSVQRETEPMNPEPEPVVQSAQAPASIPAPSAPGGPAGAEAGAGAGNIDEMARRLYDPILARLRADFWLDRERSGLLTDLRP